ncbi:hypothetical protein AAFF_G00386420 [Aldrovandia affinis]|uniref:Uncharacterized protein n=1 Tax=Aldrovandia affinis TaxID=143900 RepID=A0AAD7WLH6_9TELE|nr:hypothetical protein AAFF_G00386420 [Aldrovandia affinis]
MREVLNKAEGRTVRSLPKQIALEKRTHFERNHLHIMPAMYRGLTKTTLLGCQLYPTSASSFLILSRMKQD